MVKINLRSKGCNPTIEYNNFKSIEVSSNAVEEKVNFLAATFREEVVSVSDKKKLTKVRKLKKLLKVSVSVLALMSHMAPRALATTAQAATVDPLTPVVVMKFGLSVAGVAVACGVAVSMVMLTVAGIYRMMRKKKEADLWTSDILRGLVQVLISIPTVYLLYAVAKYLFQNLDFLKLAF